MAEYVLQERAVPLDDSWDVIVVGGGPAGCAAATAAAREGARTLLLEATGMLGGMGTAGLVPWFCGYNDGEKVIARGIADHVRLALHQGMPFVRDASRALLHGRKMAGQYRDALAEYHPAFTDGFLAATGALLGIRETRRIVGDAYLTADDYLAARSTLTRSAVTPTASTCTALRRKAWNAQR